MTDVIVYQQVEGEAGFIELGTVPNDLYAELIAPRFNIKAENVLVTVTRKIEGRIAWLIKTRSPDPIVRSKMQRFDDIAAICSFLGWSERESPELLMGGRNITDVVEAWLRVSGLKREQLNQVLDTPQETQQ